MRRRCFLALQRPVQISFVVAVFLTLSPRFEGEDGRDAGGLFKEWMSEISKQLVTAPLFLPVFSDSHGTAICQRLNPLPEELGLQQPEQQLRLLGIVLGLSVVRRIPIGENLSMALAKLLLGQQPELEDLQYELMLLLRCINVTFCACTNCRRSSSR